MKRLDFGLQLLVALALMSFSSLVSAEIQITPKHLVILRPGIDSVWGSYVFALQNTGEEEAEFRSEIMLPKETVDFMPQEGLSPEQVSLSDKGIRIDGRFPSGVHIISIGFKVEGRYGAAALTFTPVSDVQSFTVLVPRDSPMIVSSGLLKPTLSEGSPDPQYAALGAQTPLVVGETYELKISGLPEGRTRLWALGGVVGGIMLILCGFLTWRTRPQITEDAGSAILVG